MTTPPKTIGLLGGVASGKSTVAAMLGQLGATVLDADALAHDVLREPPVAEQIRHRWGDQVLDGSGRVDRAKLAAVVFQKRDDVEALNALVHPGVIGIARSHIEQARRRGAPAVVLDAALLLEAGMRPECDLLIFVEAPAPRRQELAQTGRGWSAEEVARRESFQAPISHKRDAADYVVHNHGSRRDLFEQVEAIWRSQILG